MKKHFLIGLFAITFLVSWIFGALILRPLPTAMAIKLDGEPYELQLQFMNGTPISAYDWGEFTENQRKILNCKLTHSGSTRTRIIWRTSDFPTGWKISILIKMKFRWRIWREGTKKTFAQGEIQHIKIVLKELNGVPEQSESFSLDFTAFSKNKFKD